MVLLVWLVLALRVFSMEADRMRANHTFLMKGFPILPLPLMAWADRCLASAFIGISSQHACSARKNRHGI